ncbi:MAG: carboxypeptidase regulatory-like domain-containing protein [Saprospiraceae bacterium]|nr:carboxypeptidase regulatory-like domain-containing protein [Saprospiraceae bacterium]
MKITLFLTTFWLMLAALFSPAETTVLTGKVSDESGGALRDVAVKILKNRVLVAETTTRAEGEYRLALAPGTYDVVFSKDSFVSLRIVDVQVLANKETQLSVHLEMGTTLGETLVRDFSTLARGYGAGAGAEPLSMRGSRDATVSKRKIGSTPKLAAESKPAAAEPPPAAADEGVVEIDGAMKRMRVVFSPETYEEMVEAAGDAPDVPLPGRFTQPTPRAGLLTAGEWNDLHNWNRHWLDLLADGEIEPYQAMYGFYPKHRYTALLLNEQDFPIADAAVVLKDSRGATIWESRTDNTGKAELWAGLFDKKEMLNLVMEAWVQGEKHEFAQLKTASEGINFFKIKAECRAPKNVDIVWAVDATGSMGDEIEYLKTELLDVIERAKNRNPGLVFRMGTVFYRDKGDEYITKSSALASDISKTVEFIKKQSADGGGDYPEAVHSALEEVVFAQKWSADAIARICFLVLDASPHQLPEVKESLQKSIREAARLGIRVVPVVASGSQKDTEFLMKFFGLATNGTYVFLTDHSGIGGKHLEPTSEEYKVEPFNELLVRLIAEYTTIKTCEGKSEILFADNGQQQGQWWQAFYYPNPVSTQFTLELPFEVQSVTIFNSEGKSVRKLEQLRVGRNTVVVSDLSAGYYTIRIMKDGRAQTGKLMVVRV